MRFLTFLAVTLYLLAAVAIAGDLEDGKQFYRSKNYSKAASAFMKAAERGNAAAQYNLGLMYAKGEGLAQDYQLASYWLHKAADQGLPDAEYNLAIMYDNGPAAMRDYPEAISWYHKAAKHGIAEAYYNLGVMYDSGLGVAQDYTLAAALYRRAAEQGVAQAQFNLGAMYEGGFGVLQDVAKAKEWYRKAAAKGIKQAKLALAEMQDKSPGEPQPSQHVTALPGKEAEQEIVATIRRWAKAWSAKDVAGYLACYAESFKTPGGQSMKAWRASRQAKILKSKFIRVSISDPQIHFIDGTHAIIHFKQHYQSPRVNDTTLKTMSLARLHGKWLIVTEQVNLLHARRRR